MSVVTLSDIETFIAHCKLSSQSAYENFKVLLTQLETPSSRREAIIFLNQLVQYVESNGAHQCHLMLLKLGLLQFMFLTFRFSFKENL